MTTRLSTTCFFFTAVLLSGCANHAGHSQARKISNSNPYADEVAQGTLQKRQGFSGTKPLFNPDESYYQDIGGCESGPFHLKDLMVDEIRVSNQELSTVSKSLNVMGYEVIDLQGLDSSPMANMFTCDQLPVVVIQSRPEQLKVNFNDNGGDDSGAYSSVSMDQNSGNTVNPLGQSNTGELDSFLTYYHPDQVEQFNKLNWLVQRKLDAPSAQVYIETLVLEVREEDSEEFGITFQEGRGDRLLNLGSLVPGDTTLGWVKDTFTDPDTGLQVFTPGIGKRIQIKALIDNGKAEVLSRPSVLAVSNRQAVIQIVDVIQTPELSSTLTESGNLQISAYQFNPLPIGITLNLKPRVSANRDWLTLEIDATVEAEDDENSGQVYASTENGESVLLAEKQGSNSKKVRTFARIPDRTPIIIGGLVSKSSEKLASKVPILGDIPFLGKLFTSYDDEVQKREIIIVLTPYILDENAIGIGTNQPDKAVMGRLSESLLFKNTYRIKNDDLFDVSALQNSPRLMVYKEQISLLAEVDPSILSVPNIQRFMDSPIPGSQHLLNKTVFDIVAQSDLSRHLKSDDISVVDQDRNSSSIKTLVHELDNFTAPSIAILDVNDQQVSFYLTSKDNRSAANPETIALTKIADITRLKNAIVAADIIDLNGGYQGLKLDRLHPGMELTLPKYPTGQAITISPQALALYYDSENYYQSTQAAFAQHFALVEAVLQANNHLR